ncbi:transcription-repair coupling factor [Mariniplasma anaerobium]|uniref:Transcription-repair-coupling factor n=1 Tax=Mariniplasma anaerobium TaxID=2735436 RepID=A0A7U9XVH0_9MOLU|nr:transcription-repair coupling factor [Mariniplasma anaerobium]BCR35134.1 transcription-repair-coupling factor [Mariniplasma anaerobium]
MLDVIKIDKDLEKLLDQHKDTVYLKSSTDSYNCYLITKRFLKMKKTVFVVTANLYEAQKYYDSLSLLNQEDDVLFYPADETLTSIMALGSPEFKSERLYTLKQLMTKEAFIVVTTMQGISQRQLTPQDYKKSVKQLLKNENYNISDLTTFLVYSGYQRTFTVEKPGEFSLRGHILDIYTLNNEHPYRLDFFGDSLEQIKIFSVETQRSFAEVDTIEIAPMHELFYTDQMKDSAIKDIQKHFEAFDLSERENEKFISDIESIDLRQKLDTLGLYIPFFNKKETTVLDFSQDKEIYLIDVHKMKVNQEHIKDDLKTYQVTMNGQAFLSIKYRLPLESHLKKQHIEIDNFGISNPNAFSLNVMASNQYQSNLELFYTDMMDYIGKYKIYLCIKTNHYFEEMKSFLKFKKISYLRQIKDEVGVYLLDISSHGSFISVHDQVVILDESELFTYKVRKAIRYRSVLNQSTKIRKVEDLTIGDYVVHYDYGIGQYVGLKTMELSSEKRDYLHIIYANEEALYVPMDQIDMVLKYSSHEGQKPKISKLGGKTWTKTKASVRMRIKDLSDRLIKLYAIRDQAQGFAFSKDNDMMEAFERDFKYETTRDQQKAIIETKHDMQQERPMDRLICGDVGFGKTEVALRASFKAVLNQKQVLYLVPTTVLARQHYYTFKERFDKYGANVALLSRFVTPKQQKQTIEKLAKGYVDVVIGTHRLLSSDIKYKDLGLLIIDEEQRFGVEQKEKIREIKHNVDTLTLSATPIPRTLQMSLMGLKDLSMIETPPMNRYPVQTYVVERQDALIKEAITREISRGGQIFYLFNRVTGMEGMVRKLQKLVPDAKIGFAHGKMNRESLESVISDFIDHQFDILVSTTIIETGVDIPNTNTLIIHEADKLGLSQLYQIRGRVGRSDRIAYAYLLYDQFKSINDEAKKRLAVIQDFTALGSGYKIATRDLSIRGAGDILGAEQSGFIDSVGIELYMKLLEEAITGESIEKEKSTQIDQIYAQRHVDPQYVAQDSARIEIHKRISELNNMPDIEDLKLELTDRFGQLDADLLLYMYEKLYKKLSYKIGAHQTIVDLNQTTLILSMDASSKIDGKKLFEKAESFKLAKIRLSYIRGHIHIQLITKNVKQHWLYLFDLFLEDFIYN